MNSCEKKMTKGEGQGSSLCFLDSKNVKEMVGKIEKRRKALKLREFRGMDFIIK